MQSSITKHSYLMNFIQSLLSPIVFELINLLFSHSLKNMYSVPLLTGIGSNLNLS